MLIPVTGEPIIKSETRGRGNTVVTLTQTGRDMYISSAMLLKKMGGVSFVEHYLLRNGLNQYSTTNKHNTNRSIIMAQIEVPIQAILEHAGGEMLEYTRQEMIEAGIDTTNYCWHITGEMVVIKDVDEVTV